MKLEIELFLEWLGEQGLLGDVGERDLLAEFREHHTKEVMSETKVALEEAGCVSAVVIDRDVVGRIVLDDLKKQIASKGAKPVAGKTLRPLRAVVSTPVTVGFAPTKEEE